MGLSDIFDWVLEQLSEAWDNLKEFPSQIADFFSGFFEGLGEFSLVGLLFAALSFGIIFMFKGNIFKAFDAFPPGQKVLWEGIIYIGSVIAGYLIGRRAES